MSLRSNDHLTVHALKELLEVIDTNRKASLAMWYISIHDADDKELEILSKEIKKVRPLATTKGDEL